MNQFSLQLSNDALMAGLALARARSLPSLEELIEQLLLEGATTPEVEAPTRAAESPTRPTSPRPSRSSAPLDADAFLVNPPALTLERPPGSLALPLGATDAAATLPLPFLTNRLSPLKASVRALANLAARDREWPRLRDFQAEAGHAAREHGLRLLTEDRAAGRRGRAKRSVAWPIGGNPAAALDRFAFAFTLADDEGVASGPLATLELATLVDGRALLTEAGWELAAAPSPLLEGGEGSLSPSEVAILRDRLLQSAPERRAITEFLSAVRRAAGAQPRIDELLASWHVDWTAEHAAAQRSAMIGRLGELGTVGVTGRGSKARVELRDVGAFEVETSERSAA